MFNILPYFLNSNFCLANYSDAVAEGEGQTEISGMNVYLIMSEIIRCMTVSYRAKIDAISIKDFFTFKSYITKLKIYLVIKMLLRNTPRIVIGIFLAKYE